MSFEQREQAEAICEAIDPRAFPRTRPEEVPTHSDTIIIAQALAAHLAKTTEDAVFIKLSRRHLTHFASIMERIRNAASKQGGRYALTATHWAAASIERLAGRALTDAP